MFKKFLITVCGSFVGSFIAILVSMFFMMMLGVAIAAGFGNIKTNIQNHSILVLDLSGAITEQGKSTKCDIYLAKSPESVCKK